MDDITHYISKKLNNKIAAINLSNSFIEMANSILNFPYGVPVYKSSGYLNKEYRSVKVKNFLMFYTINEDDKIITIVRVLYKKMNIENILK